MYFQLSTIPYKKTIPTTGQTVSFDDNSTQQCLSVVPAGSLAVLNVNLPSNANSSGAQLCVLIFRRAITLLTVDQIGGGATVLNAPVAASIGSMFVFMKSDDNTWACIS